MSYVIGMSDMMVEWKGDQPGKHSAEARGMAAF